jgi:hypothetical protein
MATDIAIRRHGVIAETSKWMADACHRCQVRESAREAEKGSADIGMTLPAKYLMIEVLRLLFPLLIS